MRAAKFIEQISVVGVAALLCATLSNSAAPALGSVTVAVNANIDKSIASLGTNIYSGDHLNIAEGGNLRLRIGEGQLYLLALSEATVTQDKERVNAQLFNGTAGFSATAKDPLEIETAVGMLRPADDTRTFGQATVIGVNRVQITCYQGTLLLTRGAESRKIEAGRSYTVSVPLAPSPQAAPQGPPPPGNGNPGQWAFDAVVVGGAAVAGFGMWTAFSESPSTPNNQQ
jgi:hypothetical protein